MWIGVGANLMNGKDTMNHKRISTAFFVWAYALSVALSLVTSVLWPRFVEREHPYVWVYLSAISGVASLFALVVFLVFIYKVWAAIQDRHARTSAGKATGFLLIPFFNIYWLFRAIWGFAKEFNRFLDRNELAASKLPEKLYLAFSILISARWLYRTIATLKPITGVGYLLGPHSYFLTIPVYILAIAVINKSCDAVNALPMPSSDR